MMISVSTVMVTRGALSWIRAGRGVLALVVIVAGGFAVWYRTAYHAWPGLQVPRVHWCGRDYESVSGPPQTWRQISSQERLLVRPMGWYPPVWPHQELFAGRLPDAQRFSARPPLVCAVVIYLRTGPGEYQAYTLEGARDRHRHDATPTSSE
jgi:hypothetical protein